jgi:hypothetical protein
MKLIIRKTHKYLSFFISVQLLLWTVSGIYFAFNKIELVRGEQYRVKPNDYVISDNLNFKIPDATSLNLQRLLDRTIIIATTPSGKNFYDSNGIPLEKLTPNQAMEIVSIKTTLKPLAVQEITKTRKGSEYRGRDLPIYKVDTENNLGKLINVYVSVFSGDIVAIRSNQWRIWDLMWGFHIMDWVERDNIDNFLLKIFSILALISSISGVLLFFKIELNQ